MITGANEDIDYHMLTSLIEGGYRVAGLDISGEHIQSLQKKHSERVRFFRSDVTADGDVETANEEILNGWSQIDILVNNAEVMA